MKFLLLLSNFSFSFHQKSLLPMSSSIKRSYKLYRGQTDSLLFAVISLSKASFWLPICSFQKKKKKKMNDSSSLVCYDNSGCILRSFHIKQPNSAQILHVMNKKIYMILINYIWFENYDLLSFVMFYFQLRVVTANKTWFPSLVIIKTFHIEIIPNRYKSKIFFKRLKCH